VTRIVASLAASSFALKTGIVSFEIRERGLSPTLGIHRKSTKYGIAYAISISQQRVIFPGIAIESISRYMTLPNQQVRFIVSVWPIDASFLKENV